SSLWTNDCRGGDLVPWPGATKRGTVEGEGEVRDGRHGAPGGGGRDRSGDVDSGGGRSRPGSGAAGRAAADVGDASQQWALAAGKFDGGDAPNVYGVAGSDGVRLQRHG